MDMNIVCVKHNINEYYVIKSIKFKMNDTNYSVMILIMTHAIVKNL